MNRLLNKFKGIQILQFGARAKLRLTEWPQRNIHIAAHGTLRHITIGHADIGDDAVNFFKVRDGLFGVANVRFRDDFEQRGTGPIQVDAAHALKVFVQRLASILFQVGSGHTDGEVGAILGGDIDAALADNREIHLGNLIALGQIGIEIIFPIEDRALANLRIDCQAEGHCFCQCLFIKDGQYTG